MINEQTKQILKSHLLDYKARRGYGKIDFMKNGRANFPVSIGLVRDLLYDMKRVTPWKASSQWKVIKFFELEDKFIFKQGNYILKDERD